MRRVYAIAIVFAVAAACRGGGTDPFTAPVASGVGGTDDIALGLDCPNPGELPFELDDNEFLDPERVATLQAAQTAPDPGPNHLILDFLGNPDDTQIIRGIATYGVGINIAGLREEYVSIWAPTAEDTWVFLGRTQTDNDGNFELTLGDEQKFAAGEWPVYAVVEGDATCAKGGVFVYPEGTQIIVSDIDETMTTADEEAFEEMATPGYVAAIRPGASEMMNLYADKGYKIIFVTARPYHLRMLTRRWLDLKGFPFTRVETASTFVLGESARTYKLAALQGYIDDVGLDVVRAYGNADSDFLAYTGAGVPEDRAFSIGEESGFAGTTGIAGEGYEEHIQTHVQNFPDASQAN